MNPENFREAIWLRTRTAKTKQANADYRKRHREFKRFNLPKEFYFKILNDRQALHWAIIVKEEKYSVYFIDINGRAFDKVEFDDYNFAKKELKKIGFYSNISKKCPYRPIEPVFVNLCTGKKSAPYSKIYGIKNNLKLEYKKKITAYTQSKKNIKKDAILKVFVFLLYVLIQFSIIMMLKQG